MKGFKRSLQEGGIRVPMIVRWPGKIEAGTVSDHPWYFPDVMPTLAELTGSTAALPEAINGISVVPVLTGKPQRKHPYMFWNFGKNHAVRMGKWKAIGLPGKMRLFDLSTDIAENHDLAAAYPEKVQQIAAIMSEAYRPPRPQKDDGKYRGLPPKQAKPKGNNKKKENR
jgi:arylsulfatase A-like enzyme